MIFGTREGPRLMSPHVKVWFSENGPMQGEGAIWNKFEHPHSKILCGAALPGVWFSRKSRSLVFCNPKKCFFNSTEAILNGTRLDGHGLKNECVRFQYGTKLLTREFDIWSSTWLTLKMALTWGHPHPLRWVSIKDGLPYMALTWGHNPPLTWPFVPIIMFCGMS